MSHGSTNPKRRKVRNEGFVSVASGDGEDASAQKEEVPAGGKRPCGPTTIETLRRIIRDQVAQRNMQAKRQQTERALVKKNMEKAKEMERRRKQQAQLPVFKHRDVILQAIKDRRVVIIAGNCGCGKSTQVPQYILDSHILLRKRVNILVTQPRRLAATSIASRVAKERGTRLGSEVGFMIGGRTCYCSRTRLKFVTTGVLQEILLHERTLKGYTHIIMDEVHERTTEIDIVAACLKQILQWNQRLKVIIMSATIDCTHFAEYFAGNFPKCVQVPAEVLEEWNADTAEGVSAVTQLVQKLIDAIEPALDESTEVAPHIATFEALLNVAVDVPKELEELLAKFSWDNNLYAFTDTPERSTLLDLMQALRDLFEAMESRRKVLQADVSEKDVDDDSNEITNATDDNEMVVPKKPPPVVDPAPVIRISSHRPFKVRHYYLEDVFEIIDVEPHKKLEVTHPPPLLRPSVTDERKEFFWKFFAHLHRTRHCNPEDTFLLFLPGSALIQEFRAKLAAAFGVECNIHTLHSTIPIEDQQRVMLPSPDGRRKVILSTNIAESSITVPNVKVVIDFCLAREIRWNADLQSSTLDDVWVSQSSAEQRAGRAGRVCDGEVYRWVTKREYRGFQKEQASALRCQPLDILIMKILQMQWGDPEFLLARTIDPPTQGNIIASYGILFDVGAVVFSGEKVKEGLQDSSAYVTEETMSTFKSRYLVTKIGRVLATLNCGTLPAILILYGSVFGVLEECLVLASIITKGNPIFSGQENSRLQAARAFIHYSMESQSDLIAGLHAYRFWRHCSMRKVFQPENETEWCQQNNLSLYHLREIEDMVVQLKEDLADFNYCTAPSQKQKRRIRQYRRAIIPGTVDAVLECARADDGGHSDDDEDAVAADDAAVNDNGVQASSSTHTENEPPAVSPQVVEEFVANPEQLESMDSTSEIPAGEPDNSAAKEDCAEEEDVAMEDEEADEKNLLDPEDDLAKVLEQMGSALEAKKALGLDPSKVEPYREQESDDSEEELDEDDDADDGRQGGPSVQDVRIPDHHMRLLPLLLAGAFMPNMLDVGLAGKTGTDGWMEGEKTSHMVKLSGFSRQLQKGDVRVVIDSLQQQHIAKDPGHPTLVPTDGVKRAQGLPSGVMFLAFESPKNPKRRPEKFCDRFPQSVRLVHHSASPAHGGTAGVLSWKKVSYHPLHEAKAKPIFNNDLPVRLDPASVACPLLLLPKEDENDMVTLIPANLQGQRNLSSLHARHITVLYGSAKRELVLLLFHRALKLEQYGEAAVYVKNLHKVSATLRGFSEDFFLQISPEVLQSIVELRNFINRAIMFPVEAFEEKRVEPDDLFDLEAELEKLNLQDKVSAFAKEMNKEMPVKKEIKTKDEALAEVLGLEERVGKTEALKRRYKDQKINTLHTVACQSSLVINERLLKSFAENSIYRNENLLTTDQMQEDAAP